MLNIKRSELRKLALDKFGDESLENQDKILLMIGTGLAARVSYTTVGNEKEVSYETLISIHDKMSNAVPFHASPFEHCARVMSDIQYQRGWKGNDETLQFGWCRNFRGFIQYRELIKNK